MPSVYPCCASAADGPICATKPRTCDTEVDGADLAVRLREKSIDLQYSKATEFSPEIEKLILLAAKVALLTFGARAVELKPYEHDVYYYKAFPPPQYIVIQYDAFKAAL